jgi:hypothetical protein
MTKFIILLMDVKRFDPKLINYTRNDLLWYFVMNMREAILGYFVEIYYKVVFHVKYT